jgi:hypothetical protein
MVEKANVFPGKPLNKNLLYVSVPQDGSKGFDKFPL